MNPEDYLSLPYHFRIVRDVWSDGTAGWFAEVEELPGCMTQAASLEELDAALRDAMHGWIAAQLERGEPVPGPRAEDESTHSGKFLVRLPRSLHATLAAEAENEGVSLNALVTAALSAAVAWRRPDPRESVRRVGSQRGEGPWAEALEHGRTSGHLTPDELSREFGFSRAAAAELVRLVLTWDRNEARRDEVLEPAGTKPRHVTPDQLSRELDMPREAVIRLAHELHIPIYHGRIDRSLFEAVRQQLAQSPDNPPSR